MIRHASPADIGAIVALGERFAAAAGTGFPFDHAHARASARQMILSPAHAAIWLWEHDEVPAGFLAATLGLHPLFPVTLATEHAMWVEPSARGAGAAARLLGAFEGWARTRGAWGCVVSGFDGRVGGLYARRGYEPQPERHWMLRL